MENYASVSCLHFLLKTLKIIWKSEAVQKSSVRVTGHKMTYGNKHSLHYPLTSTCLNKVIVLIYLHLYMKSSQSQNHNHYKPTGKAQRK